MLQFICIKSKLVLTDVTCQVDKIIQYCYIFQAKFLSLLLQNCQNTEIRFFNKH